MKIVSRALFLGVLLITSQQAAANIKFEQIIIKLQEPNCTQPHCSGLEASYPKLITEKIDSPNINTLPQANVIPRQVHQNGAYEYTDTQAKGLNQHIKDITIDAIKDTFFVPVEREFVKDINFDNLRQYFSEIVREWRKNPEDTGTNESKVKVELIPQSKGIIGLKVTGSYYVSNTTHPNYWEKHYLLSLTNARILALNDFIKSNKQDKLTKLVEHGINKVLHPLTSMAAGKALRDILDNHFYFDENGMVFVFSPYEVGSYAQGRVEVKVPYQVLNGFFN